MHSFLVWHLVHASRCAQSSVKPDCVGSKEEHHQFMIFVLLQAAQERVTIEEIVQQRWGPSRIVTQKQRPRQRRKEHQMATREKSDA